jgi:hypothetical protein
MGKLKKKKKKKKKKKEMKRKGRGMSQEQIRKGPLSSNPLYDGATSQMGKSQRRDYGIEKLPRCSFAQRPMMRL